MVTETSASQADAPMLDRVWHLARRVLLSELALVSGALALLIIIFFYDIVFQERTLLTSGFLWGVMGTEPPFGYPDGPPTYNIHLLDPLASVPGEATAAKIASVFQGFKIPLWDANTALGRPLLASLDPHAINPLRAPIVISPSPEVWDGYLLARFFIAGLFTYLFAKRLGVNRVAAFGAAVAFTFSGYFMLYVNEPHPDFAMLIPVILYAFDHLFHNPGALSKVFATVVVALAAVTDNPEATVAVLTFGAAYYAALVVTEANQQKSLRPMRRLVPLAIVGVTGVGLAAYAVVPFIELAGAPGLDGLSVHRHTPGAEIGVKHDPLEFLISLFLPYFDGAPTSNFQGTGWSGIRSYAGIVVLLLAALGIWNRRLIAKGGWFFAAAAVLVLAKIYGVPLVNWIGTLPVLNVVDIGLYFTPTVGFSLAMLAALGLHQLSSQRWRVWQILAAGAISTALLSWLVWLNSDNLGTIPFDFLARNLGLAAALAVVVAVAIVALGKGLVTARMVVLALVALIAGELFIYSMPVRGDSGIVARAVYGDDIPVLDRPRRHDPFTEPPYVSFLLRDESVHRVFGLDRLLYPNTSGVYGIDDIRGFTATTVERYLSFVKQFINPSIPQRFTGARLGSAEREPTAYVANPMFDLLNVKYVVTRNGLIELYEHTLAETIVSENPRVKGLGLKVFRVGGREEAVLFQHPPSSFSLELTPSEQSRFLVFRLALDPVVWSPDRGDGVLFELSLADGQKNETLFSRWLDPKNDPKDRRWVDGAVDLSPYQGRSITLTLSTSPGESTAWDWAGWGDLRLADSPETGLPNLSPGQYELVYDNEVRIYRNNQAFPRAFVVHRAEVASGMEDAIARMKEADFDPAQEAVIEGDPPLAQLAALADGPPASGSTVRFSEYKDSQVRLQVETERPGLLVLADTYYPGWKAYVDGEETPIYPTDVALRSVYLEPGEHEVEFVYSPASFKLGVLISGLSLLALASYAGWAPARGLWTTLRERRRSEQAENASED